MDHPPILVLGYSEASALMGAAEGERIKAVISIYGHHEWPLQTHARIRRLELFFDDFDVAPSNPMAAFRNRQRQRRSQQDGLSSTPPQIEHAQSIIDFARSIHGLDGCVLLNCGAGISRSPAAALLCLATWMGRGCEAESVEKLMRVRSCAIPHVGLVAFGDQILKRDGTLIEAIQRRSNRTT